MKCFTRMVSLSPARRAPQGARGLKYVAAANIKGTLSRAPQGARGLKFRKLDRLSDGRRSRPARGAWVEISPLSIATRRAGVAPRKGRVG